MSNIWKYYSFIAERCNAKKDENGNTLENENGELIQLPYSFFSPFYECEADNSLNELVSGFFEPEKGLPEYGIVMNKAEIEGNYEKPDYSGCIKPYEAQYDAIFHAVNDPLTIIQGPPGTGKTETIVNIIRQIYTRFKTEKTVAVVSNNSEAVNNVRSFIEVSPLKIDHEIMKRFAKLGNQSLRKEWHEGHSDYKIDGTYRFESSLLSDYPFFTSTIHSLRKLFFGMEEYQFDYVIIDESTQVSVTLGLIAMGSAKHLIVLGDEKQLSAIISDTMLELSKEFETKYDNIDDVYKEKEEYNFLTACKEVFSESIKPILLNKHYRCHPSIINFCNDYIYDRKLDICTKCENKNDFKMRAIWYEGDYHETTVATEGYNSTTKKEDSTFGNCNIRQIRIFLEEELPRFNEMNKAYIEKQKADFPDKEPEELSVAIIAPFRAQLNVLKEALNTENIESQFEDELLNNESDRQEEKANTDIPILTVHKSQGRGYDIVYLMTVVDNNDTLGQWAQKMRMVNVAVSRAKKEFCIITSNCWIPADYQIMLKNKGQMKYEPIITRIDREKNDGYYFCKLLKYISENCPEQKGDYGYHKTKLTSIFDKVPYIRAGNYNGKQSAPEHCMEEVLKENFAGYDIRSEVPLALVEQIHQIQCDDESLIDFMKRSKFDFVLCKDNVIKLIIEVDGSYHRNYRNTVLGKFTQPQLDSFKDEWIEKLDAKKLFLRLPTNGSTDNEIEIIRNKLEHEDKPELTLTEEIPADLLSEDDKPENAIRKLLNHRNNFINEQYCSVDKDINTIKNYFPNYSKSVDYSNKKTRAFYHCKYSMAYSFEYAMLWDIILRIYKKGNNDNEFSVCSFGCGSMTEAWSLAYAKARLTGLYKDNGYNELLLSFTGIDIVDWEQRFLSEDGEQNCYFKELNFKKNNKAELVDFAPAKVYIFPKLLNHLDDKQLITAFRNLKFDSDKCYICISHNRTSILKKSDGNGNQELDRTLLGKINSILQLIAKKNKMVITDDIFAMMGDEKENFLRDWNFIVEENTINNELIDITENPRAYGAEKIDGDKKENSVNKCYIFKSSMFSDDNNRLKKRIVHFGELNKDFSFVNNKEMKEMYYSFNDLDNDISLEDCHTKCMSRVDAFAFQIIILTKENK